MLPTGDLPLATRSSGISMPWSRLLRTRWVRGSAMRSIRPLSSSVLSPMVLSSICLFSFWARSRTTRGKRENTTEIGIMRIDITDSCMSRVLRSSCARPLCRRSNSIGSSTEADCASMAWVITSSPTRLISLSTLSISTRIEVSPPAARGALRRSACATSRRSTAAGAAASGAAGAAGVGSVPGVGADTTAISAAGVWMSTKKPKESSAAAGAALVLLGVVPGASSNNPQAASSGAGPAAAGVAGASSPNRPQEASSAGVPAGVSAAGVVSKKP